MNRNEQSKRIDEGNDPTALIRKLGKGIPTAQGEEYGQQRSDKGVDGAVDEVDSQVSLGPGQNKIVHIPRQGECKRIAHDQGMGFESTQYHPCQRDDRKQGECNHEHRREYTRQGQSFSHFSLPYSNLRSNFPLMYCSRRIKPTASSTMIMDAALPKPYL